MTSVKQVFFSESGSEVDGEGAGAPPRLSLRCADVHPVSCDAEWISWSATELVARAVDHGTRVHGFTEVWYTPHRIARIHQIAGG